MEREARIYIAGGDTLIGAALLRQLKQRGYEQILEDEPDLTDGRQVEDFFERKQPEYVFLVAGRSGGIAANQKYPADLMMDNLLIETNVIRSAHQVGVRKLLYLASSCTYPKFAPQPMQTDALMTGKLESTNEAYAIAKLAGIGLCQAYYRQYNDRFISGIPANNFGPGDDFSPEDSHVIGALIHKMHVAKEQSADTVEIWGTGEPRREFIYADDLADASIFIMGQYDSLEPINIGSGVDVSIRELALLIKDVVGFAGELYFDSTKPDGMPLKALDSRVLLDLGWQPKTSFEQALTLTYEWYLQQRDRVLNA